MENAKPKKLSMQEQMLADAMAQAGVDEDKVKAIGSTVESKSGKKQATYGGSLEGSAKGGAGSASRSGVAGIVKRRGPREGEQRADKDILDVETGESPPAPATVFTGTRAIEELD